MNTPSPNLPIVGVLDTLRRHLAAQNTVILQADPGAGKSTVVPLALLDESWLGGRKILLLQPRRIAARAVAARMAQSLREKIGETVGYRMRLERRTGPRTRIEVVTEGMLTRQLQRDPLLEDVGCIIFDEFHERSLQADLGLALACDVQQGLRDDLRILLMSATLDSDAFSEMLNGAPVIRSSGRSHPVETFYRDCGGKRPRAGRIAHVIHEALAAHDGSLLVFLPGIAEIRRVAEQLESTVNSRCRITPLHGGLDLARQAAAIEVAPPGERKIVLATSIAETSLTIEGISVVIDAGLERRAEMDARSGMTSLVTVTASRASAEQRRGRAGRLGPGWCYRLWAEAEQNRRPAHGEPEIMLADLAPLALELLTWGVSNPDALFWMTPPPRQRWEQALRLLRRLDAVDDSGKLTAHGKRLGELGLHPRLAHMLVRARELGAGRRACAIAALLQERSPFRGANAEPDFSARLALLDKGARLDGVDRGIVQRARKQAEALARQLGVDADDDSQLSTGAICALAYPDRIGQRRGGVRPVWRLSGGGAAFFPEPNTISDAPWLVVTELDGRPREARIFSAAPIEEAELRDLFADQLTTTESVRWDAERQRVVAESVVRLGEIVLQRDSRPPTDADSARALLLDAIRRQGLDCLPWSKAAADWRRRIEFLAMVEGLDIALPDLSDAALLANLEAWLGPWLDGMTALSELMRLDLLAILKSGLDWSAQQRIDELAPPHLTVPSGRRIALRYQDGKPPVLAVRLQEMFSATETPTVAGARVPVLLHLLSPAQRPVQITNDLPGFWAGSYAEVRKEMKGRYPKHHWPEDPVDSAPHATARPRKK